MIAVSTMTIAPGTRLGPYDILAELGHGGMGIVYTVHDPRLKRQVAIKVLPPDLTRDDTAKQRFLQEAKAASASTTPTSAKSMKSTRHPTAGSNERFNLAEWCVLGTL